jgi:hypothetical protein
MGRTIPSFRIAAEMERAKWRNFRSLLKSKDRNMIDEMFSYVRFYNSACMMQASPFVFHSVIMSILFQAITTSQEAVTSSFLLLINCSLHPSH